jgi:galactokinase
LAAKQLAHFAGSPPAQVLSDVAQDVITRYVDRLEPHLARRTKHFITESQRVTDGIKVWDKGTIEKFGQLMTESCKSSIEQYECGVQAIHDLQQIVSSADGVLGSRFMGGGFGGCVVGFVKPSSATAALEDIKASYQKIHPEVADQAAVYLAQSDDGVRFI